MLLNGKSFELRLKICFQILFSFIVILSYFILFYVEPCFNVIKNIYIFKRYY